MSWLKKFDIPEPVMNYSHVFEFERDYDVMPTTQFFHNYLWPASLSICGAYIFCFHYGSKLMRAYGPDLELKPILFFWNLFLAVFSVMGSIRMLPELYHCLYNHGFQYSVCNPSFSQQDVTGFWTEMFAWSKILEFGDTVLLVLRKRDVIFLHWYHHVTVLIYTWHACKDHTAAGRWFICMNYTIHAFMYAYYAIRAAGINRVPKWISMTITTSQLGQMIIGCYIAYRVYLAKSRGEPCSQTNENVIICLSMYATYAALFAKFFYDAYLSKRKRRQQKEKATKGEKEQLNGSAANGVMNGEGMKLRQRGNKAAANGVSPANGVSSAKNSGVKAGNGLKY